MKPQPKKAKAAGKGKKSASAVPEQADDDAEHSASSLSSLGGSAAENAMDSEEPSSKGKRAPAAKGKARGKAAARSKTATEDNAPNGKDSEPAKPENGKEPAQPKPRGRPPKKTTDGAAKKSVSKRAIASSSANQSPKKKAAAKGKAQPQSSTQLSDQFLYEVFGDSQPKPAKKPLPSDTESSSDEDEHRKVLKLFDTTRHTPQKRKGKEMGDTGRGKKQKMGESGESATSSSSESEAEPELVEFKRDLR